MVEVTRETILNFEWQAKVLPRVPSDETFFGVGHTPDEAVGAALDEARRWFDLGYTKPDPQEKRIGWCREGPEWLQKEYDECPRTIS